MARRPARWRNPAGYRSRVRTRGVFIGTRISDAAALYLNPKLLSTHLSVTGSTGSGKTRFLLSLCDLLARIPKSTLIVLNAKGSFGSQLRDQMIANGHTKRLVWFSPGNDPGDIVPAWNPLAPNSLSVAGHAKAMRESLRAAWGQTSFDQTAQLARYAFLSLAVAREQGLTLIEALQVLRPQSPLRAALLPRIKDPFLREALCYLDSQSVNRQDEMVASTLARLEAFVMDPLIRNILTQRDRSMNMDEIIRNHQILICDLPVYAPLRSDDVKLLGRLLLNDILARVFARPPADRSPVFLVIDELQLIATGSDDLAVALEAGRELGLHCTLSHQHIGQLREGDATDRLYDAVMNCARTKAVFGGLSVAQLEPMVRELCTSEWDPMKIKDEIRANEILPIESRRRVVTHSSSTGVNRGRSRGESIGSSSSESVAHGSSWGRTESIAEFESEGNSEGVQAGLGLSQMLGPDGEICGATDFAGSGVSSAATHSRGAMRGTSHTAGKSEQVGRSTARSQSSQASATDGESESSGQSVSLVPFYEYLVRERVTSRTFWTLDEFLTKRLQVMKSLPQGHFVLKTPNTIATIVRAPFVATPFVAERNRREAFDRIYAQDFYAHRADVELEEQEREQLILEAGGPEVTVLEPPVPRRKKNKVRVTT